MRIAGLGIFVTSLFALPGWAQASGVPAGIEQLHKEDVAATLAGDPERLANLFTANGVLLQPGSAPQIGRAAILAENLKEKSQHPDWKQLQYTPIIHDVQVHGDCAVEWIEFSGSFQEKPGVPAQQFRGKGLRVLQREQDGTWRFSHVAWNTSE